MLKTVKGIYNEGKIEFLEILPNIPQHTQVIISNTIQFSTIDSNLRSLEIK